MASNEDQLKSKRELMIDTSVDLLNSNEREKRMINDLPPELMPLIIEHLDLLDLPNCRLVSKLWRFYIDRVQITELIAGDGFYYQPAMWIIDMKYINMRNRIKKNDTLHRFPFELAKVRRLVFQKIRNKHEFVILKLFPNVEHLEIEYLQNDSRTAEVYTLDSPELKKLNVILTSCRLTINSRIEALSCFDLDMIHCVHPLDIKFLQLWSRNNNGDISIYKNVECLSIIKDWALSDLLDNKWMLKEFKNLKIIKCYFLMSSDSISNWKDPIDRLTVLRSELGKEESLKIYFNDTELIGTKRFEEYEFRKYTPLN